MRLSLRRVLACLFFLSGFSSLVYQIVWTRLAFASFGIIAPVLSIVLSVFMLGLAIGSWAGGRLIVMLVRKTGLSAIFFYGAAELLIGLGAFAVPLSFATSQIVLTRAGQVNSFNYLFYSAVALGLSIFPWCLCMGTTFPFMMAYVREQDEKNADSFSFLYISNVFGAMVGTILTALVLVELLGFHHTLWVAAGGNFLIALISAGLGVMNPKAHLALTDSSPVSPIEIAPNRATDRSITLILFSTGFVSMAMEVVWSRGFVGVLKTQVYSFALILFTYLTATFVGSVLYRRDVRNRHIRSRGAIFFWMAVTALFPIFLTDPTVTTQNNWDSDMNRNSAIYLLTSICPLCALLGYLTPSLIDEYSAGHPRRGGSAYAANVIGCILGPLVACYLLAPRISSRYALILLGLPFTLFWLIGFKSRSYFRRVAGIVLLGSVLCYTLFSSKDLEERMELGPRTIVKRDYIASVVATGDRRADKVLWVNGLGMTILSPITKFISHLPLALHKNPPESILVICFGMGTSYRSALTWGIDTTVVELVPSVPKMFGFYHADADRYVSDPKGHIVIDDGRRYLSRCGRNFDVIVVDPPPPVQAAGSSLLFSTDFYTLAKQHLNPGGIVQMWFPGSDMITCQAVVRSMYESFPYTRCFGSVDGWGLHLLGSMEPINLPPMEKIIARIPAAAQADMTEWSGPKTPGDLLTFIFANEYTIPSLLNPDLSVRVTDDRPFNEYYLLRRMAHQRDGPFANPEAILRRSLMK